MSLLAPSALVLALQALAVLEEAGVGATAATVATAVNGWSVAAAIGMLLLDAAVYLALAVY